MSQLPFCCTHVSWCDALRERDIVPPPPVVTLADTCVWTSAITPFAVLCTAPTFTLTSSDGIAVSPATVSASSPYIVEFFEASCQHCQQAASQLCREKVAVYAVDAANEDASTLSAFHRQYAPTCHFPLLLDPHLSVSGRFGVTAVPTVYVVSGGRIAYAGAGLDGVAGLDAAVARATGG